MTTAVAEAYMLILRPVPVIGEAWAVPFNGQIYIDQWDWTLKPGERQQSAAPALGGDAGGARGPQGREGEPAAPGRPQLQRAEPPPPFEGDALVREVARVQRSDASQAWRDRRIRELITRASQEYNRAREQASTSASAAAEGGAANASEEHANALEFNFKKNTDLATSQMLYLLANNDLIPTVILTVFHRSSVVPVTLIITMLNVRFTSCKLAAEPGETMTDMVEDWAGTYEHVSYAYQNRPPIGLPTSAAAAATQGRVKAFIMEPRG